MMTSKNKVVLLLSCCVLFSFQAVATTFTVNTTLDAVDSAPGNGVCATALSGSPCSLRAAIMEANAYANTILNGEELPDIINLNDGVYRLTIPGTQENLSASGDLDITDHLTINGNASDRNAVVIDASGASDRVMHILSESKVINIELNYLSITGGRGTDTRAGGGGICIKCIVNNGNAFQPTGLGSTTPEINTTFDPGNEFSNSDTTRPNVILRHVEIYSNYDEISGSGIMNAGVLTIEDSVIRDNSSSFFIGRTGGQNGQFNNNSQFIGGGMGGAITNMGGKLTIRRSIIANNRSQIGGAIFSQTIIAQLRDEQVFIENSQITGNQAFMGGAIFNVSGNWNFTTRQLTDYGMIVSNSTIDNNQAEFAGGGIYNLGLAALQLSNVTLTNNQALDNGLPRLPNKGGGIYHSGRIIDIINTTITGNSADPSSSVGGVGTPTSTDATGGSEIYLDVTEANTDPQTNLPWRISLLNTIVGDASSTDACNGTTSFNNYIINIGGNVDDSGTCLLSTTSAKPNAKPNTNATTSGAILGTLTNNSGIPGNELPDVTFPPTLALLSGNAIGSGIDCNANDQRGFGRDVDACDPGAFQTAANTKGVSSNKNNLPIARNDRILKALYEEIIIPLPHLLANDNDPLQRGAATFNITSVQPLDQNAVSVYVGKGSQANNTSMIDFIYFTPVSGFIGETGFSYNVSVIDPTTNQTIHSETAIVMVEITEQNLPPTAYSQSFLVLPGETLISDLSGGLSTSTHSKLTYDPEQTELRYIIGTEPVMGDITISPDGSFSYIANADASGSDGFTYAVEDTGGLLSRPASVIIYFKTSNLIALTNPAVIVEAGRIANIDLQSDAIGDFSFSLQPDLSAEKGEILWLDEHSGELLYHAKEGLDNTDSFGFNVVNLQTKLDEGEARSLEGTANITILPTTSNSAPEASSMELSLDIERSIQILLVASDADDDVLFYKIKNEPEEGQIIEFNPATGSLIYTTDTNASASGNVSFDFTVTDGLVESQPATVSISFAERVNEAPIATDDTAITPNDMAISINVLSNDNDANRDNLQVSIDSSNSREGGTVSVNNKGIVRYTPPDNFIGEDLIDYHIDDGQGGTDTAALKVAVIAASEAAIQIDLPDTPDQTTEDSLDTNGSNDNNNVIVSNGTSASASLSWLLLLSLAVLLKFSRARVFSN